MAGVFLLNWKHQSKEADMVEKIWQLEKITFCEHVGQDIAIENKVVYPAEHLPDQPPRILARRCSNALECNMLEKPACALCGTNPYVDFV
jgi:hypothetical protein